MTDDRIAGKLYYKNVDDDPNTANDIDMSEKLEKELAQLIENGWAGLGLAGQGWRLLDENTNIPDTETREPNMVITEFIIRDWVQTEQCVGDEETGHDYLEEYYGIDLECHSGGRISKFVGGGDYCAAFYWEPNHPFEWTKKPGLA